MDASSASRTGVHGYHELAGAVVGTEVEARPHRWAERTAELDALILRWIREFPDHFEQRVLQRLEGWPGDGCWRWTRSTRTYGVVRMPAALDGSLVTVHRAVYVAARGALPYGLVLDHDVPGVGCGDKLCAQPLHLTVSTHRDNTVLTCTSAATLSAARTHCPREHPLDGADADLREWDAANGKRACRRCMREISALTNAARTQLGITWTEYAAEYSKQRLVAEKILGPERVEQVLAACAQRWGYR